MSYDEDISCNPIFQQLSARFPDILEDAPSKSLLICIPKNAIAQEIHTDMQGGDLLNYVMRPVSSSPGSNVKAYQTLTKKRLDVIGMRLYLRQGFSQAKTVGILFEEMFYNQCDKSYSVVCVDQPFEGYTLDNSYFYYSRTSLVGTPGDRQNVFALSGIRINRYHLF